MFGQQSAGLIGNESLVLPITIGVILLISVLNSLGSKTGGLIQTVATIGKLIPLALIIVFGFVKGGGNNPILTPMVGEGVSAGGVVGSLLIAILFAYDGWINVGAIAGEAGISGKLVGTIDIYDKYTFVEVPKQNAKKVLEKMKDIKIKGNKINIERANRKRK